jgi:hypothetical protein
MGTAVPPTRTKRYKVAIQKFVLSKLSPDRIRELRKEYADNHVTIAELSQKTGVPPVLLWAALTPLYEKVQIKHRLLNLETKIYEKLTHNIPRSQIATELALTENEVANYTVNQFSEMMFTLRPWYNQRYSSAESDDEETEWEHFTDENLPPASRIGWMAGELSAIKPEKLGRCPTCGKLVHMPCYACALKEHLKTNPVPPAKEVAVDDAEEEPLPPLMFR